MTAAAVPSRPSWLPYTSGAVLTTLALVLITRHIPPAVDERALDAFGYVLLVVAGASVGFAWHRPRTVLAVVTAAVCAYLARRYAGGPIFVTGWVALFALRWATDRRTALLGAGGMCLALFATGSSVAGELTPLPALVFVGWSLAAVFVGDALRNRRSYLSELEERARYLEHTREEEARRRVAEDRLRIARDLHDSVAHAMATITVQAGAAAHVVDRRPEAAAEALTAIRKASSDVLDELGAMLRVLRDDGEAADRAPTPGLDRVAELVGATAANGLAVTCDVMGPTSDVPAAVGTAAYRIVQESLTNVLRHAPAATARVLVDAAPGGGLTVEVADDGAGAAAPDGSGTGMGLRGMRERAESAGGTFSAGPAPGGGFVVRARWEGRT